MTGTEIAPREPRSLKDMLLSTDMQRAFAQLVPTHVTAERMTRLAIACTTRTRNLSEVPQLKVIGALVECASLGLEPNTPLQHVHLIPFKNRRAGGYDLQVIIGYRGLLELGRRTGKQISPHADVVREGDFFEYEYGTDAKLRHRPTATEQLAALTHAYCFVQLVDGHAFNVLPPAEVLKHRGHSMAFKRDGDDSIWGKHEDRMWRKTAIRVLYGGGEVPLDTELAMALAVDDRPMRFAEMGEQALLGKRGGLEDLKEGLDLYADDEEGERGPIEIASGEPSEPRQATPAHVRPSPSPDTATSAAAPQRQRQRRSFFWPGGPEGGVGAVTEKSLTAIAKELADRHTPAEVNAFFQGLRPPLAEWSSEADVKALLLQRLAEIEEEPGQEPEEEAAEAQDTAGGFPGFST